MTPNFTFYKDLVHHLLGTSLVTAAICWLYKYTTKQDTTTTDTTDQEDLDRVLKYIESKRETLIEKKQELELLYSQLSQMKTQLEETKDKLLNNN
jgi:septal ring factor EnvC (AmiA/AmiB activator)